MLNENSSLPIDVPAPLNPIKVVQKDLKIETFKVSDDSYERAMFARFGQAYLDYRDILRRTNLGEEFTYPIHIELENVYACNLKCGHCARNYSKQPDHQYMSDELFKRIVDEAVEMGTRSISMTTWGEVLMDKKVFEKLHYMRERGVIDIRMHSNGVMVTQEVADKLVDAGVTWINISLDAATKETYAKTRGGNFDKAISAVGYLINAKLKKNTLIPKIRVSFVNQRDNEHEVDMFKQKFAGIADVTIQQFRDRMNNVGNEYYPSVDIFEEDPMELEVPCVQPFERVYIRYNGAVNPCCNDLHNTLTYDKIGERSLFEVYNSEKAKRLKKSIKAKTLHPFCKLCLSR